MIDGFSKNPDDEDVIPQLLSICHTNIALEGEFDKLN